MLGGQLDRDHHRRCQRRGLGERAPAGDERDEQGEAHGEDLHRGLDPLERMVLAPDAEGRGAIDLAFDRSLVERCEAGVDGRQGEHEPEHGGQRDAVQADRAKASEPGSRAGRSCKQAGVTGRE